MKIFATYCSMTIESYVTVGALYNISVLWFSFITISSVSTIHNSSLDGSDVSYNTNILTILKKVFDVIDPILIWVHLCMFCKLDWRYNHCYYVGIIYTQYKMMKLWRMSDFTNCMKGKNSWDPTSQTINLILIELHT